MRINPDSAVDMAESAGAGFKEDNLSLKNRIRPAAYLGFWTTRDFISVYFLFLKVIQLNYEFFCIIGGLLEIIINCIFLIFSNCDYLNLLIAFIYDLHSLCQVSNAQRNVTHRFDFYE